MTREQFALYVSRLEPRAQANPTAHLRRTAALAVLGYGYIVGALVGCVAAAFALLVLVVRFPNGVTIKLGLVGLCTLGGMAWAILRAMWVRLPPPEGRELKPPDVPALFALIEDVGRELSAPIFHRVILDTQYNASVVQTPRLGMLGWQRNHLVLGLPLLQGLSPDEFKGVLAHEFGHLSGQHGRFGNWLYRLRITWLQTMGHLQAQGSGWLARPLTLFLGWFWPKFNGHAFVLSRANEYEADAAAARLVTPRVMGHALTRVALQARSYQEEFWEEIGKRVLREPEPPATLFTEARQFLLGTVDGPTTVRRLQTAFRSDTNSEDTHPCLRERLEALGVLPDGVESDVRRVELPVPALSAAQALLGEQEAGLMREFEQKWVAEVATHWKERHAEAEKLRSELAAKTAAHRMTPTESTDSATPAIPGPPPTPEALWEQAQLVIQLEGDGAAVPLLEKVVAVLDQHVGANFVLGRHYLSLDDPRGVVLMERALSNDPALTHEGAGHLHAYHTRAGNRDELKALLRRVDQADVIMEAAQQERAAVAAGDAWDPHGLDEGALRKLAGVLAADPAVVRAHLVRKRVKQLKDQPVFVLWLERRRRWWKPEGADAGAVVARRVLEKLELPGMIHVLPAETHKQFRPGLVAVPDSEVFVRPSSARQR